MAKRTDIVIHNKLFLCVYELLQWCVLNYGQYFEKFRQNRNQKNCHISLTYNIHFLGAHNFSKRLQEKLKKILADFGNLFLMEVFCIQPHVIIKLLNYIFHYNTLSRDTGHLKLYTSGIFDCCINVLIEHANCPNLNQTPSVEHGFRQGWIYFRSLFYMCGLSVSAAYLQQFTVDPDSHFLKSLNYHLTKNIE